MNKFVWNEFGILASVRKNEAMVFIENSNGVVRKMSVKKYKESALEVYEKAHSMIGQAVTIRTSQNTSNWDTQEWFSEIDIAKPTYKRSGFLTVGETEPKPDQSF